MITTDDLTDQQKRNLILFEQMVPGIHQRLMGLSEEERNAARTSGQIEPRNVRFTVQAPAPERIDAHTYRMLEATLERAAQEEIAFFDILRSHDAYFLMVFGVGQGIDLTELLDRARSLCVFVIEPDMASLWRSFDSFDWYRFVHAVQRRGGTVHFLYGDDPNELSGHVWRLIRDANPCASDGLTCVIHDHAELADRVLDNLRYESSLIIDALGHFFDETLMMWNAYRNLGTGSSRVCVQPQSDVCGETPAFIVASGPSLDSDLEAIRQHAGRAVVISCGSALRALMKNGIVPDFQIEIENLSVSPLVAQVAEEHDISDVCLVAAFTVDPDALSHFENIVYFFRPGLSPLAIYRDPDEKAFLLSGPTVANAALDFALESGFKELYFFGTDFGARSDDHHHAKDTYHYTPGAEFKSQTFELPVPANFGGTFHTSRGLFPAIVNFSDLLDLYADSHRYYNCSDGAALRGAVPRRARDLAFAEASTDKHEVVRNIVESFPVYSAERFRRAWNGPAVGAAIDRYVEAVTALFAEIEDFGDKAYLVRMMKFFRPSMGYIFPLEPGLDNAVNSLFRGTLFGMLIYFEYFLARVADPTHVQRFGEIGRDEILTRLGHLREIAKDAFGGDRPKAPPTDGIVAANQGKPLPKGAAIGRNTLCPCGSGERYKHCHGVR